jgi:beta-lactamase class D
MDKKMKIKFGVVFAVSALIIMIVLLVDRDLTDKEVGQVEVPEKEVDVTETIEDPYGYAKVVDVVEYLGEYDGVRDIIPTYSGTVVYLYDNEILIKGDGQYGTLIHNDYRISTFDIFGQESKIGYIAEIENGITALYTYDYEFDEITGFYLSEGEGVISDLSWIDFDNLLVIVGDGDDQHGIYTFNLTEKELMLVYEPLENETFIGLRPNSRDYIGIGVRVLNEVKSEGFQDLVVHLKKEDLSTEFWYRVEGKNDYISKVDSFDDVIDDDAYEVVAEYDDGGVYRLNWNKIGIEVDGKKIILDEYAHSIQLSPDKSKITLVLGEQDAWSGMYIYDIEKACKISAVDVSIYEAPKEAIWIDNERLLFIYGYPGGHFSIGGSIYEYNVTTGEKRLIKKSDERQEFFDLKKKDGLIEVSTRTHNEAYTRSIIDSFLIDDDYKMIENDPTILTNRDIGFSGNFDEVDKSFIIYDINNDRRLISSMDGYLQAESPASTFMILHTLIGLEEGVIDPDDSLIKWDGEVWEIESWNKDHTLKSAIENSVVWYFSEVAKEIGKERMTWHLDKVEYGYYDEMLMNQSGNIGRFWLNRTLSVSGTDQVGFIKKLYKGELYFKKEHMELVKELIIQEKSDSYILAGKTGTAVNWQKNNVGWFVGYVTSDGIEYAFSAMVVGDKMDGNEAREYTREMLVELGILE